MDNVKMKRLFTFTMMSVYFLISMISLLGAEQKNNVDSPSPQKPRVVNDLYPGLTTGALAEARISKLPNGILLETGTFIIRDREIKEKIAKAPEEMRPNFRKNAFFVLEQIARSKLLQAEVRSKITESSKDVSEKDEDAMILEYLRLVVKPVTVTDDEIRNFYSDNSSIFKGVPLTRVRTQIEKFLLQQKQQNFITEHIRAIGRKMRMTISASWLAVQVAQVKDNPVDKARASEKPSLVDFGATDCVACQMMAPILDMFKKKYKGKLNVLFVHVQEEPILASRYGVQSIPVQIFFDKNGIEVYRHVGFLPQNEIEKRLSDIGVK